MDDFQSIIKEAVDAAMLQVANAAKEKMDTVIREYINQFYGEYPESMFKTDYQRHYSLLKMISSTNVTKTSNGYSVTLNIDYNKAGPFIEPTASVVDFTTQGIHGHPGRGGVTTATHYIDDFTQWFDTYDFLQGYSLFAQSKFKS